MKKIILDTNFLLIPGQFGVDIFSELQRICDFKYGLFILDSIKDELEKLAAKGRDRASAKLGMELVENKCLGVIKTEKLKNVDEMLIELGRNPDIIIATQDKALKRELRSNKTNIIFLRQKKCLKLI